MNPEQQVVLLLINGVSADGAVAWAVNSGGLAPDKAHELVAKARQRITVAADYTRGEQIGLAVMRLDNLYQKAASAKDTRTALQIQRELNRLLSLYADGRTAGDDPKESTDGDAGSLSLIRQHLLPLNLIDRTYPIEEHARVAAEIIRTNGFARVPTEETPGEAA